MNLLTGPSTLDSPLLMLLSELPLHPSLLMLSQQPANEHNTVQTEPERPQGQDARSSSEPPTTYHMMHSTPPSNLSSAAVSRVSDDNQNFGGALDGVSRLVFAVRLIVLLLSGNNSSTGLWSVREARAHEQHECSLESGWLISRCTPNRRLKCWLCHMSLLFTGLEEICPAFSHSPETSGVILPLIS
ncbi:hypothetical protein NQZ68_005479 [Dissostichus eleginoides]|nr:hypothetical protein NQZ68_005479 [Dissostichus eleginoides]